MLSWAFHIFIQTVPKFSQFADLTHKKLKILIKIPLNILLKSYCLEASFFHLGF
jgi:hypothetical protein